MKIRTMILISIAAIVCLLLVYCFGDLWLFNMAPGNETAGEVAVNVI
jgi:hypothetical protein